MIFGGLIDYWYCAGDSGYKTSHPRLSNRGRRRAEFHVEESVSFFWIQPTCRMLVRSTHQGSYDQCLWALTAMSAAGKNFTNPVVDKLPWLTLVQAVFNSQVACWDTSVCGGGLRWQTLSTAGGLNYKKHRRGYGAEEVHGLRDNGSWEI